MKIAVITGASSGIGREFCKQLDETGFDEIWGIALGEDLLISLSKEMKTPFRYFALDLTDEQSYKIYEQALVDAGAEVTLLINCSGFGKFGRFDEIPVAQSLNMIDLNCKGVVRMTETTLPYMKKGANVMNIASVAAFQSVPYLNVYAATKAFVLSYSRGIREELKPKGINVTTVCPFWTKTEFFNRANQTNDKVVSKYSVMYDAKDVVKKAIKDTFNHKELSIYGIKARNQVRLVKLAPHRLIMKIWIKQQKLDKKYK